MCKAIQTRPLSTRLWIATHSATMALNAPPVNMSCKGSRNCVFQLARRLCPCNCANSGSTASSQPCHCARTPCTKATACDTRSSISSGEGTSIESSALPIGRLPCRKKFNSASHKDSLLRRLSSILMRSIPSVYSAMRGSGITTSSLILKALVCLLMAAVFLRSSQNFLRACGLIAMKPSPPRELAMRTTSEVARATASASSPAMSPNKAILGKPPRLLLVA